MNTLEKILEEVEDCAIEFELFGMCDEYVSVGWIKEIIRSHMGEIPRCEKCSRRKWYQDGYNDGKDINIPTNDGWIPVSERLPKDGTYLCTLDGELCGIDEPFTGMCGIEKGKWDEEGYVIAWQPLPEPYKGGDEK